MPIYAYRCSNCGHAQDVLRKISDPVLSVCPACGQTAYVKQVTAAGFQLKGSGWYVTDFRGDAKSGKGDAAEADKGAAKEGGPPAAGEAPAAGKTATPDAKAEPAGKTASPPAAPAPSAAPAAAPAPSGGKADS